MNPDNPRRRLSDRHYPRRPSFRATLEQESVSPGKVLDGERAAPTKSDAYLVVGSQDRVRTRARTWGAGCVLERVRCARERRRPVCEGVAPSVRGDDELPIRALGPYLAGAGTSRAQRRS